MEKEKIDTLPTSCGIYKFLDKDGNILYIGKAVNLRNRVKSYFSKDLLDRPRLIKMIPEICDIEIVETNNEIESLVLESALIKKYKPFYNSDKKDDKSYAWIYISTKDMFPSVKILRQIREEEFKNGKVFGPYPSSSAIKRIFTYLRRIYPFCTCKKTGSRECLYFHLGLCPGPHQGKISKEDYRKNINGIIGFLQGRKRGQIVELEKEMKLYSKNKEYEKAKQLRDRINDLKYLGEKIDFSFEDTEESYKERRKRVLEQNFENLKIEIGLRKLKRIECYDISNIQGQEAYGSMVVAEDGEIKRKEYRIFRIREMSEPNDPAMLKQVLLRRLKTENSHKYPTSPDLILIDGGKSQLSSLVSIIPKDIVLMGISKGKRLKRKGLHLLDEFWVATQEGVQQLDIQNKEILVDLRDEAHRFAILHHRRARLKSRKKSLLDSIPNIGPKRKRALIRSFKDIRALKKASVEEIVLVLKNRKVSIELYKALNPSQSSVVGD